jgi:hypothetical protein
MDVCLRLCCVGLIPPAKEYYQMSNGSTKLKQEPRMARYCRSPMLRTERRGIKKIVS